MAFVDEFGNQLYKEGACIYLFLRKLNHRRKLGELILGDAVFISRWPKSEARGQGHWHHILGCWLVNRELMLRAGSLSIRRVIFQGYDGAEKFWTIDRLIEDCINQPEACFELQGFERQLEFPVFLNVQTSFWDK